MPAELAKFEVQHFGYVMFSMVALLNHFHMLVKKFHGLLVWPEILLDSNGDFLTQVIKYEVCPKSNRTVRAMRPV